MLPTRRLPLLLLVLLATVPIGCNQPAEKTLIFVGPGADASDAAAIDDSDVMGGDAAPEADGVQPAPDATADSAEDAAPDSTADAAPDADPDTAADDAADSAADTAADTIADASPDADVWPDADVSPDADASPDGAADASPDTAAGNWAAPCGVDADCPDKTAHCAVATHTCVACLVSAHCGAGSVCIGQQCVASKVCKSDLDCKATAQVCSKSEGACVDCTSNADCGTNQACSNFKCAAAVPCKSSKDCAGVCDTKSGVCVACLGADDCKPEQFCNAGTCQADLCGSSVCSGTAVYVCANDGSGFAAAQDCGDGNPCTNDGCANGGCVWQPNTLPCSDNNACTTGDACQGGKCLPGAPANCDDGNPCTKDGCDTAGGCLHPAATGSPCSDGNACTANDACDAGSKCVGSALVCDDGNPCTADGCQNGNCLMVAQAGPCSDGNTCTEGDSCLGGKCASGQPKTCDDGNLCTDDSCDPAKGCQTKANAKACSDGNACTQNDGCSAGVCAGTPLGCTDNNPCTSDSCSGGTCLFVPAAGTCNDGDGCTGGDSCQNGKCTGSPIVCDDGNPCTSDACSGGACKFVANTAVCDDKNACTKSDVCSNGQCLGSPVVCNDGNACTDDTCQNGACSFAANSASCGAAGTCSQCQAGNCVAGSGSGFEAFTSLGSSGDLLRAVMPLGNDVLAVGETDNSGGAGTDGLIALIGSDGKPKWTKKYGAAGEDAFFDVLSTPLGPVVIGTSVNTSVPANGEDAWVLLIDGSGNQVSSKVYGGTAQEWPERATVLSDGLLLVGRSTTAGVASAWLARIDVFGNLLWSKTYSSYEKFSACAVTPAGAFVCHGTGPAANKGTDAYFVNIAANGDAGIGTPHGSASNDDAGGMIAVGDGTYVALQTYADGAGGSKLGLQRIKADGTLVWSKQFEAFPGEAHVPRSIALVPGVGYAFVGGAVTGSQTSIGGTPVSGLNDQGVVGLAGLDGTLQWITGLGGTGTDQMRGIAAAQGGVVAVGYYAYSYPSIGQTAGDGWQVRLSLGGQIACQCAGNSGCGDGKSCTADICVAGGCQFYSQPSGTACGSNGTCDSAGTCMQPVCGNGKCELGESAQNCALDCKSHPCDAVCGGQAAVGCWCDAACKSNGDCCSATGGLASTCAGSTCTMCQ